jgi:hypothetical protein
MTSEYVIISDEILKCKLAISVTAILSFHVRLRSMQGNCGRLTNGALQPQMFLRFINLMYT